MPAGEGVLRMSVTAIHTDEQLAEAARRIARAIASVDASLLVGRDHGVAGLAPRQIQLPVQEQSRTIELPRERVDVV